MGERKLYDCDKCGEKGLIQHLKMVWPGDMGNRYKEIWCLNCFKEVITHLPKTGTIATVTVCGRPDNWQMFPVGDPYE